MTHYIELNYKQGDTRNMRKGDYMHCQECNYFITVDVRVCKFIITINSLFVTISYTGNNRYDLHYIGRELDASGTAVGHLLN